VRQTIYSSPKCLGGSKSLFDSERGSFERGPSPGLLRGHNEARTRRDSLRRGGKNTKMMCAEDAASSGRAKEVGGKSEKNEKD